MLCGLMLFPSLTSNKAHFHNVFPKTSYATTANNIYAIDFPSSIFKNLYKQRITENIQVLCDSLIRLLL